MFGTSRKTLEVFKRAAAFRFLEREQRSADPQRREPGSLKIWMKCKTYGGPSAGGGERSRLDFVCPFGWIYTMNVFESLKLNHSRTKRAWGIFSLPTEIGELGERVNRKSRGTYCGWMGGTDRKASFFLKN